MNTLTETQRNPFGVMDVPAPNDEEVTRFAANATLQGSADDENRRIDGRFPEGRLYFRR